MKPTPTVVRIEADGESPIEFPSLQSAMELPPRSRESYIATSAWGVHLADADQDHGRAWVLTFAGQDVQDRTGWRVAS